MRLCKVKPKVKNQCDICLKTFDRRFRFANHQLKECTPISCSDCDKTFHSRRELRRHQQNSERIRCENHCSKTFCTRYEYEKHRRQIKPVIMSCDNDCVDEVIQPPLFQGDEGYDEIRTKHFSEIKDHIEKRKRYTVVNKELPPNFTYGDLKNLLEDITYEQKYVFRINIAFGFTLCSIYTIPER